MTSKAAAVRSLSNSIPAAGWYSAEGGLPSAGVVFPPYLA